jgi:hypothetical protein
MSLPNRALPGESGLVGVCTHPTIPAEADEARKQRCGDEAVHGRPLAAHDHRSGRVVAAHPDLRADPLK